MRFSELDAVSLGRLVERVMVVLRGSLNFLPLPRWSMTHRLPRKTLGAHARLSRPYLDGRPLDMPLYRSL